MIRLDGTFGLHKGSVVWSYGYPTLITHTTQILVSSKRDRSLLSQERRTHTRGRLTSHRSGVNIGLKSLKTTHEKRLCTRVLSL